jgi:hypothetical protein
MPASLPPESDPSTGFIMELLPHAAARATAKGQALMFRSLHGMDGMPASFHTGPG